MNRYHITFDLTIEESRRLADTAFALAEESDLAMNAWWQYIGYHVRDQLIQHGVPEEKILNLEVQTETV